MDQAAGMSTPLASTRALVVGYDDVAIASLPDVVIAADDRVVIAGPNGSGKTTVLKTLARLIAPVSGHLDGPLGGRRGAVYVHSSPFLFAGSGRHNVMLGAHGNREHATSALEALGAVGFSDADVRTLSTGQRQRIALARALAAQPRLLLADEPETGLDPAGLEAWARVLHERADIAIVIATHREVPGATRYSLAAR
jgi:ABC-type Mn2+/Zn2+ transport system ATPase subunit